MTKFLWRVLAVVLMAAPLACVAVTAEEATLIRAAENGHRLAMQALAHIYEKGLLGVKTDAEAARTWSGKARAGQ